MQEPAAPVPPDAEEEPATTATTRLSIRFYAFAGAFWGCVYGIVMAGDGSDLSRPGSCTLNGITFAGIAAGIGALVRWLQGLP